MADATTPWADDPDLVREALDALLEIAWDGNPPEVMGSLREEAARLSDQDRRQMLQGLLDQQVLAKELGQAKRGELEIPHALPLEGGQTEMVDRALDPLTRLIEPGAHEVISRLEPKQRAHILFKAVNRQP